MEEEAHLEDWWEKARFCWEELKQLKVRRGVQMQILRLQEFGKDGRINEVWWEKSK